MVAEIHAPESSIAQQPDDGVVGWADRRMGNAHCRPSLHGAPQIRPVRRLPTRSAPHRSAGSPSVSARALGSGNAATHRAPQFRQQGWVPWPAGGNSCSLRSIFACERSSAQRAGPRVSGLFWNGKESRLAARRLHGHNSSSRREMTLACSQPAQCCKLSTQSRTAAAGSL